MENINKLTKEEVWRRFEMAKKRKEEIIHKAVEEAKEEWRKEHGSDPKFVEVW